MQKTRKTIEEIKKTKGKTPLVCLTAYTAPIAKILDSHCDIILVGDSLGTALYGMDNTFEVTMEMMCNHGKAVVNSSDNSLIVVDMPFGTYRESAEIAYKNAAKIIKQTGCNAVKCEGGEEISDKVKYLTKNHIPVMGHIGLMPQNIFKGEAYKFYGKNDFEKEKLLADAIAIEKAGAFAIVLECVEKTIATEITNHINIPTIAIGASYNCDGQILVTEDILGMFEKPPRFVKKYSNIAEIIEKAVQSYAEDTRNKKFPVDSNLYG